ncbi:hypothetical protein BBBOND_0310910 [Babesia bigemina]|uniref:4Fe-4S ferredoxin-type domain-containing protein n=1 Tax=Babesia bigemina TaxID=5866 RepID=A0A061D9G5_BABBI|nr:hypothetical protein BBBOND_0310910 [Babesia bigemina]CDR97188.1 hypothetical protein BBBOND_0310910 [Babesia bigemina]|eukprot:XP_012769374.1 hypothetical protein BBBOND_0310910 [Babesia bigemina]
MAEGKGTNKCGCDSKLENGHKEGPCDERNCVDCYVCCMADCPGCKALQCEEQNGCKCNLCDCGCQKDPEVKKGTKACHEINTDKCKNCLTKCKNVKKGGRCKCYLCNCGCNGVNCQCCKTCNPNSKCSGTCDRDDQHSEKCAHQERGACGGTVNMGKYHCAEHRDRSQCDFSRCNPIYFGIGKCRFKCTNCGKLCSQDQCRIRMRIIIVVAIILAFLLILWALFPKKVRGMMIRIRAALSSSPRHTGRSLSNLVGDRIPD